MGIIFMNTLSAETKNTLADAARAAMEFSYSPYSNFKVGAALLGRSGKIYTGCNIENSSFGATNCAERTALFKAVSEGEKEFDAIAITSSGDIATPPCGICRQALSEFAPKIKILLVTSKKIIETSLPEIFGMPFEL